MYVPMTRLRELKAQGYEPVVRIPRHTEQNIASLLSHQNHGKA
jgi:2-keto-3-deoxy-L-rhamnonate aldolase RhmA